MNERQAKRIKGYVIFFIGFQVLFLLSILMSNGIPFVPNPFFRVISYGEWQWYLAQPAWDFGFIVIALCSLIECAADIVFFVGIMQVLFGPLKTLSIPLSWKIGAPLAGALIYSLFFLYFKYAAEHYRLYMSLVLPEVLSLVLMALLWAARRHTGNAVLS